MRLCVLRRWLFTLVAICCLVPLEVAHGQSTGSPTPAPAAPTAPADALGRSTPRGALVGFLSAARKGDHALARHYLNTRLNTDAAEDLAHELFTVLDTGLPARLTHVSDVPEGSRADPLAPDIEIVGTIDRRAGRLDIVLERVTRKDTGPIWLFSAKTLEAIPGAHADVTGGRSRIVPADLAERRIAGVRLIDWITVLIGLPAFYLLTAILNRLLVPVVGFVSRRFFGGMHTSTRALPMPARLLTVAILARWLLKELPVSLLVRQYLALATALVWLTAVSWLLILLNGVIERSLARRIPAGNYSATLSLLRVGRRIVDVLVVFVAGLALLRYLDVDPTPLLAGLGVGGVAVALAAQKTLENVIAGASLIFDQAVRIGDTLKVGEIEGTVEHVGLRSTRIRTLSRTVVSVPNGQIANMTLETLSARDKFWFHPIVGLRYETTPEQMTVILGEIRNLLTQHRSVDAASVRVRLQQLGAFSLDVEVFGYVIAADWPQFLAAQEELLFGIRDIVHAAGAAVAFPSQTMYVERREVAESA